MKYHKKIYNYYMNKSLKEKISVFIFLIIVYLISLPSYYSYLPTIPVYDNNEAYEVEKITKNMDENMIHFFKLTDRSISHAFNDHVKESVHDLDIIIDNAFIIIMFFKLVINRPRPYQINKNIDYYDTSTGKTPAMPAGHAFQAYYLSNYLSKKYPKKKEIFEKIAKECDLSRVKAGLHYPSDGQFSKKLVNLLF